MLVQRCKRLKKQSGITLKLPLILSNFTTMLLAFYITAFLQGKPLSRKIFLKPPKEADTLLVWLLKKAVYGLTDAGRHWYNRVKEEFLSLGLTVSRVDKAVFYFIKDNTCHGIIVAHVDDFLFGGDEMFHNDIILQIRRIFVIGLEESKGMKYLGLEINQVDSGIHLSMDEYIESIMPLQVRNEDKSKCLEKSEYNEFRQLIGQVNWCATQIRVDICFNNCRLSNATAKPCISDLLFANKTVKCLKSTDLSIVFSPMSGNRITLLVFCDASFANLPSGGSQGAYVSLHCRLTIDMFHCRLTRKCQRGIMAKP